MSNILDQIRSIHKNKSDLNDTITIISSKLQTITNAKQEVERKRIKEEEERRLAEAAEKRRRQQVETEALLVAQRNAQEDRDRRVRQEIQNRIVLQQSNNKLTLKAINDNIDKMQKNVDRSEFGSFSCSRSCPEDCNFNADYNVNDTCTLGSTILGSFLPDKARTFFINKLFLDKDKYDEVSTIRGDKINSLNIDRIADLKETFKRYIKYIYKNDNLSRRNFEHSLDRQNILRLSDNRGNAVLNNLDLIDNSIVFFLYSLMYQSNDIFKLKIKMNKYLINNQNINNNVKVGSFDIYSDNEPYIRKNGNYLSEGVMNINRVNDDIIIDWAQGFNTIITKICYKLNESLYTCTSGTNYLIPSPFYIYPAIHLKNDYNNYNNTIVSPEFGAHTIYVLNSLGELYYIENILEQYQKLYYGYFINKFMNNSFNNNIPENIRLLINDETNDLYFPRLNNQLVDYIKKHINIYSDNLEYLIVRYRPCSNEMNIPIVDSSIYGIEGNIPIDVTPLPKLILKNSNYVNRATENGDIINYKLESVLMGLDASTICEGEVLGHNEDSGHSVAYIACGDQWYLIDDQYDIFSTNKRIQKVILDKNDFIDYNTGNVPRDTTNAEWSVNKRDCTFMYGFNDSFYFEMTKGNQLSPQDVNNIKDVYESDNKTRGWWSDNKMRNNNYIFVILKQYGTNKVVGVVGIDNDTLELGDDAVHKDFRGMNLYQHLLRRRIEYIKQNYKNILFYLFTEIPQVVALHSYAGMSQLPSTETGNFRGKNNKMYSLGAHKYFTFEFISQ